MFNRRQFLKTSAILASAPLMTKLSWASDKNVLVVGGGAAGVIAARTLVRLVPGVKITVIDKNAQYSPAFAGNLLIKTYTGNLTSTFEYKALQAEGIQFLNDEVKSIDPQLNELTVKSGKRLSYDRLVLAPGASSSFPDAPGYSEQAKAWHTGQDAVVLKQQLQSMEQGGVVVVSVPTGLRSGPWGAYERVSQVAAWMSKHNSKAKIILLEGGKQSDDFKFFKPAWDTLYPGRIETVFESSVTSVNNKSVKAGDQEYKSAVYHAFPSNNCNTLLLDSGLATRADWAVVKPGSFAHNKYANIHILGDNVSHTLGFRKTAQSANAQAKNCAIAISNVISGKSPFEGLIPIIDSQYAILGENYAVSSTNIFRVDKTGKMQKVSEGQSLMNASTKQHKREVQYALSWYRNITGEMFL